MPDKTCLSFSCREKSFAHRSSSFTLTKLYISWNTALALIMCVSPVSPGHAVRCSVMRALQNMTSVTHIDETRCDARTHEQARPGRIGGRVARHQTTRKVKSQPPFSCGRLGPNKAEKAQQAKETGDAVRRFFHMVTQWDIFQTLCKNWIAQVVFRIRDCPSNSPNIPGDGPHERRNQCGNAAFWLANLLFVGNQAR